MTTSATSSRSPASSSGYGAEVLYAENGRTGIEALERNEDISLVLMDVMMPELDGNATMRAIRQMPQFAELPIIAAHRQGDEGRPGEEHQGRRVRLRPQARGHRSPATADAALAAAQRRGRTKDPPVNSR